MLNHLLASVGTHGDVEQAEIDGELSAMVDVVIQDHPPNAGHARHVENFLATGKQFPGFHHFSIAHGGKRGASHGDILVEYGGRAHIFGRVIGTLTVKRGAKVIHSGVLGGDAINKGGRLYIENTAMINGKVKTLKGETKISKLFEPPPTGR